MGVMIPTKQRENTLLAAACCSLSHPEAMSPDFEQGALRELAWLFKVFLFWSFKEPAAALADGRIGQWYHGQSFLKALGSPISRTSTPPPDANSSWPDMCLP